MANDNGERNWFIEVNPGAKVYTEAIDELQATIELTKPMFYALICHDNDIEDNKPKLKHYHFLVKYQNARSFQSMQKHFEGAHIEKANSVPMCVQYLIHQNNPEKAVYLPSDIITNNADLLQHYLLDFAVYETFNPNNIIDYIEIDGTRGYVQFVVRFGVDQVRKYRSDIIELSKHIEHIKA